ncbi:hypothetical protein [Nonomuraea sp. NPDC050786]|uniref:hypothetical protein n=1 Tax=Nonomuraea sp. NPDC050786 TaxID=3154840 RepID=UPI0033FF7585
MTVRPLLVALVALALPAAACSSGGPATTSFGSPASRAPASKAPSAPRGVVTVTEARAILDQWEKAEKEVNRQGATDWTAAEAGLAAEISNAEGKINKMLGESSSWKAVVKPRFAIPGKVSGAPWFMAEFGRKGASGWWQTIFQKTSAGWRAVAMSATTSKARPPAAARDENGLATTVAPDDGDALIASPRQIAQAHARLQSTFGEDRRAGRVFAADSAARLNAKGRADDRKELRDQWTMTVRSQPAQEIYALRTSAGGALVWYGIRQQLTMTARPGAGTTLGVTNRIGRALSHGNRFSRKAVFKDAGMYLAVVPKSPGIVRIPGEWFTQTSITGS